MNVKSLSNNDCYDGEESISENGEEERYLFSCDSEQNNNEKKKLVAKWTVHNYAMSQPAITCSKLTIETLEQGLKYVQS